MRKIDSTVQMKNSADSATQPQSCTYAMYASLADSTASLGGTCICKSESFTPNSLSSDTN